MQRQQNRRRMGVAVFVTGIIVISLFWIGTDSWTFSSMKAAVPVTFESSLWKETILIVGRPLLSSVSISDDGQIVAACDGTTVHVWPNNDQVDHSVYDGWFLSLEKARYVALLGDGQLLATASPIPKKLLGLWDFGTNGTELKVSYLGQSIQPFVLYYYIIPGVDKYSVTDLALDHNGTTLAVGYGTPGKVAASYDLGDGRHWRWTERPTGVNLYDSRMSHAVHNGVLQEFGAEYQGDNFGTRLQLNANGTRVIQSTEHTPYQYSASALEKLDGNWYSVDGWFPLGRKKLCDSFTSDVGISADGSIVVIAMMCWNKPNNGNVTLYVHSRVEVDNEEWQPLTAEPLVRTLDTTTTMVPFSICEL